MVSKEQAMTESRFHFQPIKNGRCYNWRRNGKTKTWKTRPDEFRIPIKYGLHGYGYLTEKNAHDFHLESECPHVHD